jgi:hypothetical protein
LTIGSMSNHRSQTLLLLLIAAILSVCPTRAGRIIRGFRKPKINDVASFPYLYATRTDLNASFPVVEYIAPPRQKDLENDRPAFLYANRQGLRIVVFVS